MRWLLAVVALGIGCHREPPPAPEPGKPGDLRFVPPLAKYPDAPTPAVVVSLPKYREPGKVATDDPAVSGSGKTFLIATEHAAASQIGKTILAAGGTAVDAAIAAEFALAVIHPSSTGLGGGGFAIVRAAPGQATAFEFRGSDGAPGFLAGLLALHGKHGKLPWKDLVAPAIALARDGFVLDARTAALLAESREKLEGSLGAKALFMNGGATHEAGTKLSNATLAATLELIAANPGVGEFARGKVATLDPLRFTYRHHAIATVPPPSAGGSLLAVIAGMLEGVDLGSFAWHGKDHVHWLAEVWKRAYFTAGNVPPAPELAKLAAAITDKASAASTTVPAFEGDLATQVTVVDRTGLVVSITTTMGAPFGNGKLMPAGYFEGRFPGPLRSLMHPFVVEDPRGEVVLAGGAGGARESVTASWQVISNVIDFGHRASLAVKNPRIHHQQMPDVIYLEDESIDQPTEGALLELGHQIDWNRPSSELGAANVIARTKTSTKEKADRATTGWEGATDARTGGSVLGD